jgi:2-hydroxy-6-oxonona-2,4-dienedioate hydrolase
VIGDRKRPLVLVHGVSGSARWWANVRGELEEGRDVHLLDVPRIHPRDVPRWLVGWLDGAGLDRVDLVGHSLGGLICARTAAASPDRVGRLVLVAPAGVPSGRSVVGHVAPLVATLAELPSYVHRIALDALRTGPNLFRAAWYATMHDLRPELERVASPTLLVWGEDDRLVPIRLAEEWLDALADARLVRLSGGHVPMWDAPDELVAAVRGFLGEGS